MPRINVNIPDVRRCTWSSRGRIGRGRDFWLEPHSWECRCACSRCAPGVRGRARRPRGRGENPFHRRARAGRSLLRVLRGVLIPRPSSRCASCCSSRLSGFRCLRSCLRAASGARGVGGRVHRCGVESRSSTDRRVGPDARPTATSCSVWSSFGHCRSSDVRSVMNGSLSWPWRFSSARDSPSNSSPARWRSEPSRDLVHGRWYSPSGGAGL